MNDTTHPADLLLKHLTATLAVDLHREAANRRREGNPDRPDVRSDLDANPYDFVRPRDGRIPPNAEGGVPASDQLGSVLSDGASAGRGKGPSPTMDEHHDILRRVDLHIAEAEGSPCLQGFWRGVGHKFREEADRSSMSIGTAPSPLALIRC